MSMPYDRTEQMRLDAAGVEWQAAQQRFVIAQEMGRPSMMLRPRLFIDGDQWCALHGDNLQDGVAGFGDSPELAYIAFDSAWCERLPKRSP